MMATKRSKQNPKGETVLELKPGECGWYANRVQWTFGYKFGEKLDKPEQLTYVAYCWYCITEDEVINANFLYDGKKKTHDGETPESILRKTYCHCNKSVLKNPPKTATPLRRQ